MDTLLHLSALRRNARDYNLEQLERMLVKLNKVVEERRIEEQKILKERKESEKKLKDCIKKLEKAGLSCDEVTKMLLASNPPSKTRC